MTIDQIVKMFRDVVQAQMRLVLWITFPLATQLSAATVDFGSSKTTVKLSSLGWKNAILKLGRRHWHHSFLVMTGDGL